MRLGFSNGKSHFPSKIFIILRVSKMLKTKILFIRCCRIILS